MSFNPALVALGRFLSVRRLALSRGTLVLLLTLLELLGLEFCVLVLRVLVDLNLSVNRLNVDLPLCVYEVTHLLEDCVPQIEYRTVLVVPTLAEGDGYS